MAKKTNNESGCCVLTLPLITEPWQEHIIETRFKRQYIRRVRKSIAPTPTGIELIGLIHEELLKSAELTGTWEKKLRQIEHHEYDAKTFIEELKQMVSDIVLAVMQDNSNRHVAASGQ